VRTPVKWHDRARGERCEERKLLQIRVLKNISRNIAPNRQILISAYPPSLSLSFLTLLDGFGID
jgi:hypothetical protein